MNKTVQIKDICQILSGKRLPIGVTFATRVTKYPYIRARDIKNGRIDTDELVYLEQDVQKKIKKYIIKTGDIAITVAGTVGDVAFADENVNGYNLTENAVRLTNFKNDVNVKYVFYVLFQKQYHDLMELISGAVAQPKLGIYKLGKIRIELPDIVTQTKIASILSAYDELIENNNKRIKILEQMAETLYKEWFVRFRFPGFETTEFENGIPKGWKVVRVKNCLMRLPFNRLYKQDELESGGKVIVIDQSSNEFMGYHNNEPSHFASFEKPIILFGDHSCKFVLMTKNFSLGENVVPFKSISTEEFDNYYLYYAVHKLIVTEEYKRHWGRFTAMKIFKPQIDLQRKFAEFVKQLVHEKEMLWNQKQNLIKQRDLLLPRLMSGKLEV